LTGLFASELGDCLLGAVLVEEGFTAVAAAISAVMAALLTAKSK
jgi:hypothetical protein